jgi:hypothetical protein
MVTMKIICILVVNIPCLVSAFPFLAKGYQHGAADTTTFLSPRSDEGPNNIGPVNSRSLGSKNQLLNGLLPPLTGLLAGLDVPIPQQISMIVIPGDDPDHQYQAPLPTDVRGPCPAANTMANHGYIDRTGITTFAEAANACQIAFGLAYDASVFVSALALIAGGDLVTGKYSIGGQDSRVPNTLGPALGVSKHGFFEADTSITRSDAYFGNQANFSLSRWNNLLSLVANYGGLFSKEMFAEERVNTYNTAIETNPEFQADIRWLILHLFVRVLVSQNFSNGTTSSTPDYQSIAPFFLNETFPNNWYRHDQQLSIPGLVSGVVEILSISGAQTPLGQNEGMNNFIPSGIDPSTFTPTQVACALLEAIMDLIPGQISPEVADNFDLVMEFIDVVVAPLFASWDCPVQAWAGPGPDAGDSTPGVSTSENILINGVYS